MKSGNLNFLEPSGPFQACDGTSLPLPSYRLCDLSNYLMQHHKITTWVQKRGDDGEENRREDKERQQRKPRRREGNENEEDEVE